MAWFGNFSFPTDISFGPGVIKKLPEHIKEMKLGKVLVVTDPGLKELEVFSMFSSLLEKNSLENVVYCEVDKNPVKSNVLNGKKEYIENGCDGIIGIGGGASMDVARAIALSVNHHDDLFSYEDVFDNYKRVKNAIPYFITIPTTAGTGSEVGRSSLISDDETHAKKILYSPRLIAKKVFIDPELTLGLPSHITAATGIDALTHNIEAYLAKGYHPMCDGIALEGIKIIHENLVKAVNSPDLESRSNMMVAAMMGAVAFQKGLGVVHSCANALSTHKNFHHGLANALMLPESMRFNHDVSHLKIAEIVRVLGLNYRDENDFVNYLNDLNSACGVESKLSTHGIEESDLSILSKLAYEDISHQCNEKPCQTSDFEEIFRCSL